MGSLAIVLALTALLAACGDSSLVGSSTDPSVGIAVEVRRGPIMPVDRPGEDNTAPVPGAKVVVTTASGIPVAELTTDSLGAAGASVPPGDYRIATATCPGAMREAAPVVVTVVADSISAARLVCDTGIR
jgi:hypothetical protein